MPFIMKNIIKGQIRRNKNGALAAIHPRATGKVAYATATTRPRPRAVFIMAFISHFIIVSFKWAGSEEHTSELQSLMRISYAVFCLKKKKNNKKYETRIYNPD